MRQQWIPWEMKQLEPAGQTGFHQQQRSVTSMNEQGEHLRAVDRALRAWRAWQIADEAEIAPSLEKAIEDLLTVFDAGAVPDAMRPLLKPVAELRQHWQRFIERRGRNPQPGIGVWNSLELVERVAKRIKMPPARPKLESVAMLVELPGMTHSQIGAMYGFVNPSGLTLAAIIADEVRVPGSHSWQIEGWVPPRERRQHANAPAQAHSTVPVDEPARVLRSAFAPRHARPPAKETIEELVGIGVCGRQVCAMKRIERDELEAYCVEHGLPTPGWEPAAIAAPGLYERGMNIDD